MIILLLCSHMGFKQSIMERSLNSSYLHKREMISSPEELTQLPFQRALLTRLPTPFLLLQVLKLKIFKHLAILKILSEVPIKRLVLASANTAAGTSVLFYLERKFIELQASPTAPQLLFFYMCKFFFLLLSFRNRFLVVQAFPTILSECGQPQQQRIAEISSTYFSQKMWEPLTGVRSGKW